MKLCPWCGLQDYCHNYLKCELWPGVDGEWHRTLTPDSHIREPKIGYWWTFCCEEDLEQIKDEATVESIKFDRSLYHNSHVWPTEAEALKELAEDGCWKSEIVDE